MSANGEAGEGFSTKGAVFREIYRGRIVDNRSIRSTESEEMERKKIILSDVGVWGIIVYKYDAWEMR